MKATLTNKMVKKKVRWLSKAAEKVDLTGRGAGKLYRYLRRVLVASTAFTTEFGEKAVRKVAATLGIDRRRSLSATLIAATLPDAGGRRVAKWAAAVLYGAARSLSPVEFELYLHRHGVDVLAKRHGRHRRADRRPVATR